MEIYMILLPLLYWCIDEKKSLSLVTAVLISAWVAVVLNLLLDQPIPFFAENNLSTGAFPSSHAQNSHVLLMIVASWGKKKWHYAVAAFLCLLVGFFCIYSGRYFLADVLGGWVIGGIILCGYFLAGKRIESLLASNSPRAGLLACAALAFVMILYRPSEEPLMPAGLLLGFGTGYFLCRRYVGFTAAGGNRSGAAKYLTLFVRYALGITATVLLYIATGKIINNFIQNGNYHLFVFMRFALIALWVTAGAPWLFRLLRLAQ